MAGPIACDMCQSEVAHYMIGDIETGEQLALGDVCVVAWSVARVEQALPPEGIAQVVERLMQGITPPTQEGTPAKGRRKRGQQEAPPQAEPEPAGAEGAALPGPADDG